MGKLTSEEIHKRIKKGRSHLSEWKDEAKESYDFVAGNQWSDHDKARLEEQGRPQIVFNRTARAVNTISGLEVQNRQEVRYIPREQTDGMVNDVLTAAAKWARDNCDAEDEQSEAFQDLVISGMGWTETRIDYEVDTEGKIIEDRVDPLEMGYDPVSKKRNLDDARYVFRDKKLSPDEFKEKFPNEEDIIEQGEDVFDTIPHDATNQEYEHDHADEESKKQLITVTQFQYYSIEPYYQVAANGKVIDFPTDRFNKIKPQIEQAGLKYVKRTRRVYYQAFMAGPRELEHSKLNTQEGFTLKCMTGMRDRNRNVWFGIVHLMKDPQRWANKWLSQILHILNTNAKGGVLAEEGAFANPRKAEEDWSSPDALIMLNAGGIQKIQERTMGNYPDGLDRLLQNAIESIDNVPGISSELMGLTGRNQASILETQRKQSGLTVLAVFFDALRRFRKEQGRILADFIQNFIADGRLIRIVGEQGAQVVPLIKDEMTYKYDVVVADTPTSPNQKERVFAIMGELIPYFQASGQPLPPEIIDFMPLPENVIQKIKQRMAQASQPDPIQQQATMLELQGKQLENEETHSKTVLNMAKAQKEGALSQDELAQAQLKLAQIDSQAQLQREKVFNDLQIKREKNLLDAQVKREANQLRSVS